MRAARARRARARPAVARRGRAAMRSPRCSSTCSSGFDRLFDAETPYMLWIHQRPFDGGDWPGAQLHVEIVSPWRAPGVTRYVAAGELGSGVYFNPVAPEAAAQALRDALVCSDARDSARVAALPRRPARAGCCRSSRASTGCRRTRRSTAQARRGSRSLDGELGVSPGRAARGRAATLCATRRGWSRGRGAGALDDAGLRQAAVHERRDAVRRPAAERARAERDRHLPPHVHAAARLAAPPRRPALRRRSRACSTCS